MTKAELLEWIWKMIDQIARPERASRARSMESPQPFLLRKAVKGEAETE
jgi:hypothetical protein